MNNIQTSHKSELRPLPMRISQMQFERLQGARAHDGLSIQEHVRRALDLYLARIERERAKNSVSEPEASEPANGAEVTPPPANPPIHQALPAVAAATQARRKQPPRVRLR